MKAIEPSEILINEPSAPREKITHVDPWIRCLSRFLDYSLFFICLLFVGHFPFAQYERLIPLEPLAWIPIEVLLLTTWGTTPGKWFLRTKLKAGKKSKLDFKMALRRSFAVWLRGLGMGIWGLNLFCMLIAYQKLKLLRMTSWDREDHVQVTHYPIGRWRIILAVLVATSGILYYYTEHHSKFGR